MLPGFDGANVLGAIVGVAVGTSVGEAVACVGVSDGMMLGA